MDFQQLIESMPGKSGSLWWLENGARVGRPVTGKEEVILDDERDSDHFRPLVLLVRSLVPTQTPVCRPCRGDRRLGFVLEDRDERVEPRIILRDVPQLAHRHLFGRALA